MDAPQREFDVFWSMPFEADDPIDAARQALGVQRDPDSVATVFRVVDVASGESVLVDLETDGSAGRIIEER